MKSSRFISHTTAPVWPVIRPGRFAASIHGDSPRGCQIALLGLPDDTGVKLNGGRPGAAEGPGAFRTALAGFGTTWDGLRGKPLAVKVFDAGDVEPARGGGKSALMETHRRIEAAVSQLHHEDLMPVCIGGGHDLSLPSITALAKHARAAVGGINFDAHLDVRKRVGSGMAFRRLIETGRLDAKRLAVAGVGRFVNDEADLKWLSARGAELLFADDIMEHGLPARRLIEAAVPAGAVGFVSIDLDGLDSGVAPGVSALNPMGLGVRHAAKLAEAAGAEPRIRHFDLMELSPPHDLSGRTARVAAYLFLSFAAGFGVRG